MGIWNNARFFRAGEGKYKSDLANYLKCKTCYQIPEFLWYQEKKTDRQNINVHCHSIFINLSHRWTSENIS